MTVPRFLLTPNQLRLRALVSALLGAILGALLYAQAGTARTIQEVVDPRLEKACAWPTLEGEMTVVTVHNDRVLCWRWK